MILAEFGVGQVVWSVLWLSLFALWFFLIVMVFSDIFLSPVSYTHLRAHET